MQKLLTWGWWDRDDYQDSLRRLIREYRAEGKPDSDIVWRIRPYLEGRAFRLRRRRVIGDNAEVEYLRSLGIEKPKLGVVEPWETLGYLQRLGDGLPDIAGALTLRQYAKVLQMDRDGGFESGGR